jgi:UDP-glucuronate decarboxylase
VGDTVHEARPHGEAASRDLDERRIEIAVDARARHGAEHAAHRGVRGSVRAFHPVMVARGEGSRKPRPDRTFPVAFRPMVKRILVTGGAGFLGSHLCDRLVRMGHDVICLDNLFTSQKSNIEHLLECRNFEFIRHDVTQPIMLEVDEIFNLACPAAPGHYQYNPIKTMKTSVLGAINVLGLAKRVRAKVFHASTSEVYGDPDVHPQPESYRGNVNPIGPRACYDEGKRAAETLFFDYHRQNKVNIRVVRIFNTYGPRMHPFDGRVVSNFIRQALAGEPITIYGEGTQTRSFCYVDDLLDGFLALMDAPDDLPGPVNIGNPGEFTIRELAEMTVELSGSRSPIVRAKPLPVDDPLQRRPDITLARAKLGWEPKIPLREGLARTIAYFRSIDMSRYRAPTPNY